MKWGNKSNNKVLHVKVNTYDNDLDFQLSPKTTGESLFEMVCTSIGLHETCYFGLENYYIDSNGQMELTKWLKLEKKISTQKLNHSPLKELKFLLHPKFFPEDIERELIQPITRHLFYLDVKNLLIRQSVVNNAGHFSPSTTDCTNKTECNLPNGDKLLEEGQLDIDDGSSSRSNPPSDVAILLASLSAQAEYGDLSENEVQDDEDRMFLPGRLLRLLPSGLLMQCQLSQEVTRRVKQCYKSHKGMTKEDAELAYLKIAHLYRLFGIDYFMITDKINCASWFGISATGISIYQLDNKIQPLQTFSWKIIKNVSYKDRKFTIKLTTNDLNSPTYLPSQPSTPRITTPGGIDPSLISSASMSTHLSVPGLPLSLLKDQLSLPNGSATTNLSIDTKTVSLETGTQNCTNTSLVLPTIKMDSCTPGPHVAKLEVWLQTIQQAKLVMRLSKGNSELFMKRRQPESCQMQQMRIQARAERARRDVEQARLCRARAEKQAALEAKAVLEEKVAELQAALESCKTAGQLMAEKARYAKEEAKLHEEQVHELTRCLDRSLGLPEHLLYWGTNGAGEYNPSPMGLVHPGNSLPSLRNHAIDTRLVMPGTDPLSRKKLSPQALVKHPLVTDTISVQHLEAELQKEKARFNVLQNQFLSELCEAYSHLEMVHGAKLYNRNKFYPLANNAWQPGLDSWDQKKEFGPNYREIPGWNDQGLCYPQEMVELDNSNEDKLIDHHQHLHHHHHHPYSAVPLPNNNNNIDSVLSAPHTWTSDTPMMRKRVIDPVPHYYEMGGYIVNTTR